MVVRAAYSNRGELLSISVFPGNLRRFPKSSNGKGIGRFFQHVFPRIPMFLDRSLVVFDLDGTLIDSLGISSLVDADPVEDL